MRARSVYFSTSESVRLRACVRLALMASTAGVQLATLLRTIIELCFFKRSAPELILAYLL